MVHILYSLTFAKGSEVKTKSKVLLPRVASTTCWFKARVFIYSRKHSCIRLQPARHVKFDQSILGKLKSPVRTSETSSHERELIADINRFRLDKSSLGGL